MMVALTPASTNATEVGEQRQAAGASRIQGHGELVKLVRAFDWALTPLGPIEGWSETLLSQVNLLLCSPLPATLSWGEGLTFLYNDAAIVTLGEKHPWALGRSYREVFADAWHLVGRDIEDCFYQGKTPVRENACVPLTRDGKVREGYYTYALIPVYENGKIAGVYDPYQETTEAILAAQELRASEAQANRILQSIGDAVIVTDADLSIARMNPVAEALTGWREAEAQRLPLAAVLRILCEDTGEFVENPAERVKRTGEMAPLTGGAALVARDGAATPVDDSGAPIRNEEGQLTGVVLVFRNAAESRRAQQQAKIQADAQGFLLALSDRQGAATGAREIMQIAAEALGRHLDVDRVGYSEATPDLQSMVFETGWAQRALQTLSGSVPMEHWSDDTSTAFTRGQTVVYPDVRTEPSLAGQVHHYEAVGARSVVAVPFLRAGVWRGSLYVNHSQVRRWAPHEVALVEEVARRTSEAVERAHTEAQLSQFLGATRDLVVGVDREWRLSFLNAAARQVYAPDREILGRKLWEEFPNAFYEGSPFVEHYERAMYQGIAGSFEACYPEPLNMTLQLEVYPTQHGIVTFSRDVTLQRRAEAAVMQSEKLAAVGRLAASIAHEINNPLESVTNLLYLARTTEEPAKIQEYLATAERELRRVSDISSQTLRFYRQSTGPRQVTCEELLESVLSIYQGRLINSQVSLETRLLARKPVECFEGEIRQVLNNLVGNAIDAMQPNGGRLLIRSRDAHAWRCGQPGMTISIADTGAGMPASVLRKIFDAFYTTKGISGTGLGLWVSKEIVDRHQGMLQVRSSSREGASGTVFSVFLPSQAVMR